MAPKRMNARRMSLDYKPPAYSAGAPSPQVDKRRPKRSATSKNTRTRTPSRLHPSQPLHMTTRRAATNSTAGSIASADSRRSSFGDIIQVPPGLDVDEIDRRPTKKPRLSTFTASESAVQRKLSPPPPSNQDRNIPDIVATPEPPLALERDSTPPLDDDDLADDDDVLSESQRLLSPLPKRKGRRPKVSRAATPTGSVTESLILPGTPLNGDAENGTDRDVPKARKLPGRRRAPNSDPVMEACLRRQLQLRIGHRAVSKALKPVLIELARRTAIQLERQQAEIDEEFAEVEMQLNEELSKYLESRLTIVENEFRFGKDFHTERWEQDQHYLEMRLDNHLKVLQDDYDVRLEHRILELSRQYEHERDEDATDDEAGDIVHPLHGRATNTNPTGQLDVRFDSRSRFFMATEQLAKAREFRTTVGRVQVDEVNKENEANIDDEDAVHLDPDEPLDSFGTFDEGRRAEAIALLNLSSLAYAANQIEQEPERKKLAALQVIPNEAAFGLQMLADAGLAINPTSEEPLSRLIKEPVVKAEQPAEELHPNAFPPPPAVGHQATAFETPEESRAFPPLQTPGGSRHASILASPNDSSPSKSWQTRPFSRQGSEVAAQYTPAPLSNRERPGHSITTISEHPSPHGMNGTLDGTPRGNAGTRSRRESQSYATGPPPPSTTNGTTHRHFLQNILSDAPRSPRATDDSSRRRSEASIMGPSSHNPPNGPNHARKISAPERSPFRRTPPPPQFGSPWQRQGSLPPPPSGASPLPPPPFGHPPPPPGTAILYHPGAVVFGYAQPPPPPPPPHVLAQGMPLPPPPQMPPHTGPPPAAPPQQQHGVFFGPPPPPQFGGYAWYRK